MYRRHFYVVVELEILNELSDHFRSRRSVWLVVEYHGIVDEVDSFTVVVNDNDLLYLIVELAALDEILVMGINDYEEVIFLGV